MKKVLLLFFALFAMTFFAKAQSVVFSENFESGMPTGWTQIDANNDNYGWEHSSNPVSYHNSGVNLSGTGHNGSDGYVLSGSYSNATGQAITPNNWLITPAIPLNGAATLSFWVCSQDANYSAEHYGVYISTTDNASTSSFTLLQEWTIGQNREQTPWENHTINLSQYDGETVYIAFRHFNCNDQFILNLDDVEITVLTTDPLIVANPTTVSIAAAVNGSASTSVHVDGYNLTSTITATTTYPFEVSEDGINYGSTASLAQIGGTLYIQYSPTASGTETGTVTLSSTGATDVIVTVNGTALETASLPYSQNFEDATENSQWMIVNGSYTNGWYIGTAANTTAGGSNALYVSNDNGTTNAYTNGSESIVWAYRDIDFGTHSEYSLSFKYKCDGESSWDRMRIYLGAPADVPTSDEAPQGATQIGMTNYSEILSWTDYNIILPASHSGAQRLYLLWKNDSSLGENPPAAIDDIVIIGRDCGSTSVPIVSNIGAFTANVEWTPAAEEDENFFVQYVPAGSSWDDPDAVFLNANGTTVQLENLTPSTTYQLRVATDCSGDTSIWKIASFTTTATCYPPTNVELSQITGTSAMVSWDEATFGANDYTVAYSEAGQENWITETVDGTSIMLANLEPNTEYDVMVSSNCDLGTADTAELNFTTKCLVGGELSIGDGTNTSYYVPTNNYFNYSFTEQIFLASEMNGASSINSISFDYHYSTALSSETDVDIYLKHTTQSTFSSTSNFIDTVGAQLVYHGALNCQQGWNTFNFTTPFEYNGIDNLVLIVDDNSGDYDGSSYTFNVHSAGATRTLYYYSDSYNPDLGDLSNYSGNKNTMQDRNNVIFGIPCDSNATCVSPNVYVTETGAASITIDWAPGYDETAWELEYTYDTNWTSVGSVTAPYELTGLNANTTYFIRVRSICGSSEYSEWVSTSARTQCDAITNLPFTENFDTYGTGTGTYPLCWYKKNTYSSDRPYISTTHYNGQGSLYFYTNENGTYNMAITPEFDASIDITTLQATFMYRAMYQGNRLLVGVMTDPNDASTFTIVDTVFPDATVSQWVEKEVYFDQYTEGGQYIAFKNESDGSNAYSYIDNLVIDIANTCRKPSNLLISSVSSNEATLSWTANGDESSWNIAYGPVGINPTDEDDEDVIIVPANDNPFTLTGLDALTAYDVYIQADCGGGATSNWILIPVRLETAGCDTTEQCEYTFVAIDGYGDGWNGAYIEIVQNGVSVATVTAESHGGGSVQSTDTIRLLLCGDYPTQLIWHSGSFDDEASFTLIGSDGSLIISASDMSTYSTNDVITSFSTNCSGCVSPRNVAYTLSSDNSSATITWTAGDEETDWILEYQAGNEDWVTENISGTPTYTINNLTAATIYTIHVIADCGYGTSGYQTITFNTPICDSVDMCEYTLNMTDDNGDGWNGAYLTVTQSGIVVASNITVPSSQSQNTVTLSLCGDLPTQLIWHSGSWDSECSYTLLGPDGTQITSHSSMSGYSSNAIVDTFTTNCSGCLAPGNLTYTLADDASYVTITWTVGNEENDWILEYQEGTGSWITENISGTPTYTLNNLTAATTYTIRVQSDCGNGEVSAYKTISFTTPCDVVTTFTYIESFENGLGCWQSTATTGNTDWEIDDTYNYVTLTNNEHCAIAQSSNQGDVSVLTSPVFDLSSLTNPYLKFDHIQTVWAGDQDELYVYYKTSLSAQPVMLTSYTNSIASWQTDSIALPNPSSTYQIIFEAHLNYGHGIGLDMVTVYDNDGTPPTPTDPTVTTNDATSIGQASATLTATITNPSGVTITAKGFEWKQTIGGSYTTIAGTGTDNNFTANLTGLTANTNYTFRAFITFNGTTVTGDEMTFSTLDEGQQTCNVPTNLTATATAYNTANVTWTAGGSETSWNLQYRTGTANWTTLPVNATTYQITGLAAQTTYEVRVQANCGDNNTSDWTATVSFTTPAEPVEPCDAPTNLQVNSITQTSATMTWTAGGSETSWKVGYKLSTASQWQEATVQTTSYDIEGLTANSTYDVRVKAVCAADNESDFITSSFTTTGVGIDNITLANSINLMPNPADNYIELSLNSNVEAKEAIVYNAFGQMIQTVQLTENHARIDLSNMAAGMYFVRVNGEGVTATKKFIKR